MVTVAPTDQEQGADHEKARYAQRVEGSVRRRAGADSLMKKLDVDFRRYKILGACNPTLAHEALGAELDLATNAFSIWPERFAPG